MTKTFEAWYKKYIRLCDSKYDNYLNKLREDLAEGKVKVQRIVDIRMRNISQGSELDERIKLAHEEIYNIDVKIDSIAKTRKEMDNIKLKVTAKKVYDKLLKHPKIKKIEISNGSDLNIYTEKLKTKKHNIGNYKLTYKLPDIFYIRNLEYVVQGCFDHWHVKYGEPCLSSWRPILTKQIDTYQIFLFVDTLIHYLLLSNSEHSYIPFDQWIVKFKTKDKTKAITADRLQLSEEQSAYLLAYTSIDRGEGVSSGSDQADSSDWSTTTVVVGNSWEYWSTGVTA